MRKDLFLGYGILLFLFSIYAYLFIDKNLVYFTGIYTGFAYSHRLIVTIPYFLFICAFFAFYIYITKEYNERHININWQKNVLILSFLLVVSYPAMLSYDIFNYIATAKTTFFYKENPYLVMPIEFSGDPILGFTRAANKFALYGPTWILLSGIPFLLGFGSFIISLFNLKLLVFCFYLGTVWLLHKMSEHKITPILFALNPLVMIETLVSSHNDIVMVFFLLCSFFFLREKKYFYGILFFVLSIFVKFVTIVLFPLVIFILWFHYKKKAIKWNLLYQISAYMLFVVLLLSPLREELYPWYFVWVLPFVCLVPKNKKIVYFSIVLSFGLLLRYIPYMYLGTYSGITPIIKNIFMILPLLLFTLFYLLRKNLWLKR